MKRVESLELQIEGLQDRLTSVPTPVYVGEAGVKTVDGKGYELVGCYTSKVSLEQLRGDVFAAYDEWRGR